MNVQRLKQQFSGDEPQRPTNLVRTQIPVARFGARNDNSPTTLMRRVSSDNMMNGNPPTHPFLHSPPTSPQHPFPAGQMSPDKWRAKYEDVERKRKSLLAQNHKRKSASYFRFIFHSEKKGCFSCCRDCSDGL